MASWLGIDVGGKRKGFDVALIDNHRVLALEGGLNRDAVIDLIEMSRPAIVAIDSPRCCAPEGETTRDAIAAAVTACQHADGATETIGEIAVPAGPC